MAAGPFSLTKEFHSLMKHIKNFSDGQAIITEWDEESLSWLRVVIEPNDGLYKDAEFEFEINTTEGSGYPESAPKVVCKTDIYHPNIDTIAESEGDVCLNLLDELWTMECTLEDIIQGLLFLLYNPNIEDPLCSMISPRMEKEEFEENVARSLAGKDIDGIHYFNPNPKYARLHPDQCRKEEEKEEEKREEEKEGIGEDKDKEKEDEAKEGQTTENVSQQLEEEEKEEEGKEVSVAAGETIDEQPEKCQEITGIEKHRKELEAEGTQTTSELTDNIDKDVVSDEDLEHIFDNCTFLEEVNRRNRVGAPNDGSVSWSNMIYGTPGNCRDVAKLCEQCTTADPMYPVIGCAVCQQRTTKDPVCIGLRTRSERTPTVMSRFLMALQTRSFRRWFI